MPVNAFRDLKAMSRAASSHLQKGAADQTFGYYSPGTVAGLVEDIDSPFTPCLLFVAGRIAAKS